MFVLLRVLAVFLLVAANAFFVAAELSLVSIRDTRLQQLIEARRVGARTVWKLRQRLDEFLAGVQLGVTLASLALGWIGEPALAHLLESAMTGMPHASVYAHTIAIVIAFSLITYLHVLLGELVPKSVALHRGERVALAVAGPMDVFTTVTRPLLRFMGRSASFVLRLFGLRLVREGGVHSPEELKLIVTASRHLGLVPELQEDLIHRALELNTLSVREIMVPRPNIFSLPADMLLDEAASRVVEEQHSRVPVYDPKLGPEHIIGLLYSKDVSRYMHSRLRALVSLTGPESRPSVRHLMREVLVVPETKPVSDLLSEFQRRRRHLAVVVDEFGSTVGIVTVEDAIEQLVGELEDEFDVAAPPAASLQPGIMIFNGAENIRDLETQTQIKLPRDAGFETLAGFVLYRLGHIPQAGESFEHENRRYSVLEMQGNRVARIKVEPLPPAA